MGKINILDSSIFNRIAAGEVVERPKSIIKELVENSLDAGASVITITITGGGIEGIRIMDNGCGMDKDDLKKAFLPHATSKISVSCDLDNILTLGFRGEALSSIAAVSTVTLSSRMRGNEVANFLKIDSGEVLDSGECGAPLGTMVAVENLFEKIPARKKFLAKPKLEEGEISNLVARMILANSDVAFKLVSDGKLVYQSSGRGIEDAILTIYGLETLEKLSELSVITDDLKIHGYISRPGFAKYNRSYQTLIVNGRYVVDADISFAVYSCYKDYLMTRQYPMYLLFIDLPADMVDVNIHPAKMQVRFADSKRILSLLKDGINKMLYGLSVQPIDLKTDEPSTSQPSHLSQDSSLLQDSCLSKDSHLSRENAFKHNLDNLNTSKIHCFTDNMDLEKRYKHDDINSELYSVSPCSGDIILNKNPFAVPSGLKEKPFSVAVNDFVTHPTGVEADDHAYNFNNDYNSSIESTCELNNKCHNSDAKISDFNIGNYISGNNSHDSNTYVYDSKNADSFLSAEFKVAGKLFDTYILIEQGNNCYLIDQHAAHERLIYDKMYADAQSRQVMVQTMLVPYEFSLSHDDAIMLDENIEGMASIGVIIEKGEGQKYRLTGIPLVSKRFDESRFIILLTDLLKSVPFAEILLTATDTPMQKTLKDSVEKPPKKLSSARFIKEQIMQAACKAAVKGEDDLSQNEINALLSAMSKSGTLLCPHGRPAVINIAKTEIEKWFKRRL